MKTIWKFKLKLEPIFQQVSMPIGSELLSLQIQEKVPCIWAIVDTERNKEISKAMLNVYILGTGDPLKIEIPRGMECSFLGTYQAPEYLEVYHVFVVYSKLYIKLNPILGGQKNENN